MKRSEIEKLLPTVIRRTIRRDNPSVAIGRGHYYDFYQLQTKVTRRALE